MNKTLIKLYLFIVPVLFIAITSCHNNTITGSGYYTPRVYLLRFNLSGNPDQDTIFAARDTLPVLYAIYTTVQDSLTLQKLPHIPMSIAGKVSLDTTNNTFRTATFSTYHEVHTDTVNIWGTDTLVYWKLAQGDTGLAQITVRIYNSSNAQIGILSRYFTVLPATQTF